MCATVSSAIDLQTSMGVAFGAPPQGVLPQRFHQRSLMQMTRLHLKTWPSSLCQVIHELQKRMAPKGVLERHGSIERITGPVAGEVRSLGLELAEPVPEDASTFGVQHPMFL